MKFASLISIICFSLFCFPQDSMAQRFGHGAGGGARGGGGGGGVAPRGGGGGGMAPRGGGFNGGSRNVAPRVYNAPAPAARVERPAGGGFREGGAAREGGVVHVGGGGVIRNEGIYHHEYSVHPYFYHPFHPYVWGARWHPFGFFAGALAADAILYNWGNQQYYYDDGVYYQPSGSGYSVVNPPIGAVVSYLPAGYLTVPLGDDTYYYYGGTFYVSEGGSFRVVPAPPGAIVTEIPEGAAEQSINGQNYLLYNNTYYQPISQDGQDAYEVVQVN